MRFLIFTLLLSMSAVSNAFVVEKETKLREYTYAKSTVELSKKTNKLIVKTRVSNGFHGVYGSGVKVGTFVFLRDNKGELLDFMFTSDDWLNDSYFFLGWSGTNVKEKIEMSRSLTPDVADQVARIQIEHVRLQPRGELAKLADLPKDVLKLFRKQ